MIENSINQWRDFLMENEKVLYIKGYPPEMGGVNRLGEAVYNKFKSIGKEMDLLEVDVSKNKLRNVVFGSLLMVTNVRKYRKVFYCLDSKRTSFLLRIQKIFAKNTLKSTIAIIPAYSSKQLLLDAPYFKNGILKELQCIWVETESLREQVLPFASNVEIFPNARSIVDGVEPKDYREGETLHLLYYSLLSRGKGLYDTMDIVDQLNKNGKIAFDISFYGNFENEDTKKDFCDFLQKNKNAYYKGFNDSTSLKSYYERINKHDIMLFMTHWISEGIPGVCVDAKASGVAIVANNHNANKDVVLEDEGFIVPENDINTAVETIEFLYNNPELLNKLKKGSYESRIRYDIDSYQRLYDEV